MVFNCGLLVCSARSSGGCARGRCTLTLRRMRGYVMSCRRVNTMTSVWREGGRSENKPDVIFVICHPGVATRLGVGFAHGWISSQLGQCFVPFRGNSATSSFKSNADLVQHEAPPLPQCGCRGTCPRSSGLRLQRPKWLTAHGTDSHVPTQCHSY